MIGADAVLSRTKIVFQKNKKEKGRGKWASICGETYGGINSRRMEGPIINPPRVGTRQMPSGFLGLLRGMWPGGKPRLSFSTKLPLTNLPGFPGRLQN